ncbi:MAG TPA: STAS domain-containing protein [Candidatus Limnocylindrales bacterium]|nr:STAS domain-containing protein [Candidatus Limnocylindrales bacterium]
MILQLNKAIPKPGVAVLHMKGSIHTGPDCRRLEHETELLVSSKENLVIFDLSDVTHIDSAAIGSIVRCYSRLKSSGGYLRLAGCAGMIESSLKLTQLHKILEIFPSAAAAAENYPHPHHPHIE